VIIHQDAFYRALSEEERHGAADYNFDHPSAFDHALMMACIKALKVWGGLE
jgi:uridine kinase